ncbi:MAG: hypothetical protein U5K76_14875 [Woeseiaceae bacterium]|nr:hypothetical protein [Woeseiaceae bacterium]
MRDDMNDTDNDIDDDLLRAARALPVEVQPARDLWPGIAEAIAGTSIDTEDGHGSRNARPARDGSRRILPRYFAQAAAVLLLVGASSGMTWLLLEREPAALPPVAANGPLTFEPVSASFGRDYNLGPDFQDARRALDARLQAELERLPPATRTEVESNLSTIRAAIVEINAALAEQPDNALLQELLLKSYAQELRIMRNVDGLATTVMRRTDI